MSRPIDQLLLESENLVQKKKETIKDLHTERFSFNLTFLLVSLFSIGINILNIFYVESLFFEVAVIFFNALIISYGFNSKLSFFYRSKNLKLENQFKEESEKTSTIEEKIELINKNTKLQSRNDTLLLVISIPSCIIISFLIWFTYQFILFSSFPIQLGYLLLLFLLFMFSYYQCFKELKYLQILLKFKKEHNAIFSKIRENYSKE